MNNKYELDFQLEQSLNGSLVWRKLINELKIKQNDLVFFILDNDQIFNYYALLYINELEIKNKGFILTTESKVYKSYALITNNIHSCQYISKEEAESILIFYNLYMFTDKLVIISPTYPKNRTAYNLVLNGQIDVEEYISVGMFKNKEFKRLPLVEYHGDDPDLIDFFNIKREEETF